MCHRLGIHHLQCEIHEHRTLPGERAGRSVINILRKELASDKDYHWYEVIFALLRRYHNTPLYHGLSPNQSVFGREKCWQNWPLKNSKPRRDASAYFDELEEADKTVSRLIEEYQSDWLWVQNQGRLHPHNFSVGDHVWLRKSATKLGQDDKLLALWEGPCLVEGRLGANRWKIRVDVNRPLEVSGDRLKPEIPDPKGRPKPLYWTAQFVANRAIEDAKYDLEKLLEARRDANHEWEFLCKWKGFDSSYNTWEPAPSFVHGYTRGFITFLKKHPEIGVLLTDCVTKPDRQVEEGGQVPAVDRNPAHFERQRAVQVPPPPPPQPRAANPAPRPVLQNQDRIEAESSRPKRAPKAPDRLVVRCIRSYSA